jgi:hypothetical protein
VTPQRAPALIQGDRHVNRAILRKFPVVCVALAALAATGATATPAARGDAVKDAEGLWAYTALLAGTEKKNMPLTGVILFKDGLFAQQSIMDGAPFEKQGSMAHAGPFGPGPNGVHMTAEQTISTAPGEEKPLRFRPNTQHDISVERSGDEMTIVFSTGTVQKFKRIGPANGRIHKLDKGVLALVDGHFVLVDGDEQGVVTGFGVYKQSGSTYELNATRWAEATPTKAINKRDFTQKATFDGKTLALADGRKFQVIDK